MSKGVVELSVARVDLEVHCSQISNDISDIRWREGMFKYSLDEREGSLVLRQRHRLEVGSRCLGLFCQGFEDIGGFFQGPTEVPYCDLSARTK
jgi:hypothetical protein